MKLIALAAAIAVSAPALAQTMPQSTSPTPPTSPTTGTTPTTPPSSPTPPVQNPTTQQAPVGSTTTSPMTPSPTTPSQPMTTASPAADAADPAGGYMPTGPALQGTAQPGARIVVQPSMSPAQAFPAPAPLQSYPVCKRGQYDNCRQRGG